MRPSSSSSETASARISCSDSSLKFFTINSPECLRIQGRVRSAHLAYQLLDRRDLHQLTLANSRTPVRRPPPLAARLCQLRPKRKDPALSGLGGMNRASTGAQEAARRPARYPQAP